MANSNAFLHEKQVHGHLQLVSKGYLVKSSYIGLDFRSPYLAKVGTSHIITNQVDYEPADDPYVFARYIAPRLGISTFFSGEDSGDLFADRYRLLRREFLESEGIRWVSIPRLRLPDGRKIATKEIRSILAEQGLEAAKDYLTEETYQYLATQTVDGFLKRKEGKA